MTLYIKGAEAEDEWQLAAEDAPLPTAGGIIVSKERFLSERNDLASRNAPIGLLLQSGETLEGIEQDVQRFGVIVLDIPKYADGRAYSTARILRDRLEYRGELRAQGNVLRDQVNFLHRCGFDALDVTHAGTIEALRNGTIVFVHEHYQPASLEGQEEVPSGGFRRRLRVTQGSA